MSLEPAIIPTTAQENGVVFEPIFVMVDAEVSSAIVLAIKLVLVLVASDCTIPRSLAEDDELLLVRFDTVLFAIVRSIPLPEILHIIPFIVGINEEAHWIEFATDELPTKLLLTLVADVIVV